MYVCICCHDEQTVTTSYYIAIILRLALTNSTELQAMMEVDSTPKAKCVTKADRRTLSYITTLADNVFGLEFKPCILVYPDPIDPMNFSATLVARSTENERRTIALGYHVGATREEALLGLLQKLEKIAAEMSQTRAPRYWEEWYRTTKARLDAEDDA